MLRNVLRSVSALILISLSFATVALAATPPLDIYMFHSNTCPHCVRVIQEVLPGIRAQFGDRINLRLFEISDPTNFKLALVMEKLYGVTEDEAGVPEIFFARVVLIGENSIKDNFAKEIQKALDSGKYLKLPTPDQLLSMIVEETPVPSEAVTGTVTAPVTATVPVTATAPLTPTLAAPVSPTPEVTVTLAPTSTPTLTPTAVVTAPTTAVPPVGPAVTATATVSSTTATVSSTTSTAPSSGQPIHLAYFYQVGCKECDRAQYELNYVQSQHPNVVIDRFDIVTDAALSEWLSERLGVPPEDRVTSPALFVGQDRLTKGAVNAARLEPLLAKYSAGGANPVWQQWREDSAGTRVGGLLQSISLPAVLGAGVLDGLNPCALVTIVFFIAYLSFIGRGGRDILFSGIAFTVGVFVAHVLLGLGLLRVFQAANMTALGKWLYPVMAALCLVLAVLNFSDFFKARTGKLEEMQMRLPMRYRRWINKVIRENAPLRAYVLTALFIGFVVAVIELVCTGQIYAVILSALSQPALHGKALSYLMLYNLTFIVPLIIVFLLAFYGITSDQLSTVVQRHTATIKLFTALLFLGFGLWLLYSFLPLFGVRLTGGG